MIKRRRPSIFLTLTLAMFAMVFSQIGDLRAAPPASDDVVCFPSCSSVDGRFLVVYQIPSGLSFSGSKVDVEISVASTDATFSYGIFDADAAGLWDDSGAAILKYELFADPLGDGSGTFLVDSFTADAAFLAANPGLVDNQWIDRTVSTVPFSVNPAQSAQLSDSHNFKYHLRISSIGVSATGGAPSGSSTFKLRTSGALGIAPQAFSYIAQMRSSVPAEVSALYPTSGGSTTGMSQSSQTNYDGSWDFSFFVASGTTVIDLWDGDVDFGPRNCNLAQDTDDPDTPFDYKDPLTGLYITPWTSNTAPLGANNEGRALGGQTCTAGTAAPGTLATGNPADSTNTAANRRDPSFGANVVYRLIGPDGVTSWDNLDASGNQEWEKFTVDGDPGTLFDRSKMDYKVASLAPGVYRTHVEGVDIGNLNAWYFSHAVMLGLTPSGAPVPEDAFYSLSGKVFHDNNGNGVQDGIEAGIGSVAIISVYASNGAFVATANTLADGSYSFRVASGTYFVVVEGSNFTSGKPLAGYYSTTGGNSLAANAPANGATQNFGYRLAPVAVNDSYVAHKNTTLNLAVPGVQANDTNVDNPGAGMSASIVTTTGNGSVVLNPNGSFSYTPNTNFVGIDAFTYEVNDGTAGSNIATATITVVNDPPVAVNDSYSTAASTPLVVGAPGVFVNDSDPNGDPLTLTLGSTTTNGTLTLNANGSFEYTPNSGFVGVDTFTYTVNDGLLNSLAATVTITVTGNPPVAVDDSASTHAGVPVTISVLGNDSDPDNDAISITTTTSPSNGTIVVNPDGTITYTPNSGFTGVDIFTYTITDGHGGTSTATVTVTVTKRDMTVTATGGTFPYDGNGHGGVCTYSDGLTGTTHYENLGGGPPVEANTYVMSCIFAGNDEFNENIARATVTITPLAATITAGGGTKVYGTLDPALSAISTVGFINGDEAGLNLTQARASGEDVGNYPTSATLLGNTTNLENYAISYVDGNFTITPAQPTATATGGVHVYDGNQHPGTCTISGGLVGTLTYAPGGTTAPKNVGTYSVLCSYPGDRNHNPASDSSTITITPKAATVTAGSGTKVYGSVDPALSATTSTGISPADLVGLTLSSTRATGENVGTYVTTASATGGGAGNYAITYVPGTFTITPKAATVTANNKTKTQGSANPTLDGTITGALTADNITATYSTTAVTASPVGTYPITPAVVANPKLSNYTVTIVNGTLTVTAAGPVCTVEVRNDAYEANKNQQLSIVAKGILRNDVDPYGRGLQVATVNGAASKVGVTTATAHGTVKVMADGSFVYKPATNYVGTDTFTYTAKSSYNSQASANTATVTITIKGHYDGDGCDHDRDRGYHRDGDRCDHDKSNPRHYSGDGCDHDRRRNGHHSGDRCTHDNDSRRTTSSRHYDNDSCDHDRNRNGHRDGDNCSHDQQTNHHNDGDNCDHDRGVNGHRDGDDCSHDREEHDHRRGDGCDHDRGANGHRDGDRCEHDNHDDDDNDGTAGCAVSGGNNGGHHHSDDESDDEHHSGDGCDHDRGRNGHSSNDNCDHNRRTKHYEGDRCDHDRNRSGHRSGDRCDHDRATRDRDRD